jgi:adenosine 3'-phospho 5'-phosphosulfate transporter B2
LLVTINRLVSILFALTTLTLQQETFHPSAPLRFYIFVSVSNFLATFCQYEALKYVTFPTQTLGKCGKMIPVLIIGTFLQKKSYTWKEYVVALMITFGCTIFLTTGQVTYNKKAATYDTPLGLLLIAMYLAFDGFTSTTQERLFKNYKMSTYNQMLYVNLSSAVLGFLALILPNSFTSSGHSSADGGDALRLWTSLDFVITYPAMLRDGIVLSLCSSLGQLAIYYTIKEFGALIYSTIMTTRQFVGILLSALLFMHPITFSQWVGATLVFVALYWRAVGKPTKEGKKGDRKNSDPIHAGLLAKEKDRASPLLPVAVNEKP